MSGPLPQSKDSDVAANREARMTGRQIAGLWSSGFWRAIVGLPMAVGAAVVTWQVPLPSVAAANFVLMALGVGLVGCGAYLSFRAFGFLGDAITRNVSYVTDRVEDDVRTYRGSKSYYMVVGPVRTRIWRKKTFDALPLGLQCHAYYASGSLHLLSLEPVTAAEPHPALRFGGDPLHAWDRLRWSWLVPAVAVFGLAASVNAMVSAHPAHAVMVTGRISDYQETHGRSASRHLYLDGSSDYYNLDPLYRPHLPFRRYTNTSVTVSTSTRTPTIPVTCWRCAYAVRCTQETSTCILSTSTGE